MKFKNRIGAAVVVLLAGCNDASPRPGTLDHPLRPAGSPSLSKSLEELASLFADARIVSGPDLVDCTLSGGAETTCFTITVRSEPATYQIGPWCPRTVADGPEASGIWIKDGVVYDADGSFFAAIAELYDDEAWQIVASETGAVHVTDTPEACAGAARPDVEDRFRNHCVECLTAYLPTDASLTYVLPLTPVPAAQPEPTNRVGSGVAVNGVRLDGPAPIDAIIAAYTVAPFDDCGGHVNLHVGYHYHAVTDCLAGSAEQDTDGKVIGVAMDGYRILAGGDRPTDLDGCGGHTLAGLGYHYHAGEPGSNQIVGCLTAQHGCTLDDASASCDASASGRRPPPPPR